MKKIARSIAGGTHSRLEVIERAGKQYYSDLDPDFKMDTNTNDVAKTINVRAVQNSIIGIVSTRKGERAFEPDFGSDIHSSLFDNMNNFAAYSIEKAIEEAITNYEPRVKIRSISVSPNYDENAFIVEMQYHVITDLNYIYNLKLRLRDK